MLNIILFGPPGAGKGTQATNIIEAYNLAHLSTGDILRAERKAGTELGKYANEFIQRGDLVPDQVIIDMLANKIDSFAGKDGFIFDGFPRTIPQAEALDSMITARGEKITAMVMLDVPEDELADRLLKRAEKEGRADDTPEVIRHRINTYKAETLPVAGYYEKQDKLSVINGVGSLEEVFARIKGALDTARAAV